MDLRQARRRRSFQANWINPSAGCYGMNWTFGLSPAAMDSSKAAFATLTVVGRENGCPPRPTLTVAYLFLVVKIPDPLVWVAIAVWSQVDVLLAAASQPELFGPFGSNWSSL
jgi:hypothetical protein